MLEAILSVVLAITAMTIVVALSILVMKAYNSCKHSYERVDDCNDKKMVLVCRRLWENKEIKKVI